MLYFPDYATIFRFMKIISLKAKNIFAMGKSLRANLQMLTISQNFPRKLNLNETKVCCYIEQQLRFLSIRRRWRTDIRTYRQTDPHIFDCWLTIDVLLTLHFAFQRKEKHLVALIPPSRFQQILKSVCQNRQRMQVKEAKKNLFGS